MVFYVDAVVVAAVAVAADRGRDASHRKINVYLSCLLRTFFFSLFSCAIFADSVEFSAVHGFRSCFSVPLFRRSAKRSTNRYQMSDITISTNVNCTLKPFGAYTYKFSKAFVEVLFPQVML